MSKWVRCLLPAILLLAGCSSDRDLTGCTILVFGTLLDITLYGVDAQAGTKVCTDSELQLRQWHSDWHAWEPGALSDINLRLARLQPAPVDPDILPLLEESNRLARLSDHLFNPVMGRLIALWGFQGNPLPDGETPDPAAIAHWLAGRPDVDDVHIAGNRIRTDNPLVAYDLGGIAKGYAIDRLVTQLRKRGIDNAIINAGGDLRAIGRRGERPWRIGIRHPRADMLLAGISTGADTSIFTSGDYERLFEVDGRRYHHILDPRTGYPAVGTSAVTVVTEQAALADAAATALFVAGPSDWLAVAARMGVDRALLVDSHGTVHITPAMQAITTFPADMSLDITVTPAPTLPAGQQQ